MLTQDTLKTLLSYDTKTGVFRWVVKPSHSHIAIGDRAGCLDNKGYRVISINGSLYKAHRLAWLYMTGKWPVDGIDHINGEKDDNSFINIREATSADNRQNIRRPNIKNKLGILGVVKERGYFSASITVNKKIKRIGKFKTAESAHKAYITEKRKIHPFSTL